MLQTLLDNLALVGASTGLTSLLLVVQWLIRQWWKGRERKDRLQETEHKQVIEVKQAEVQVDADWQKIYAKAIEDGIRATDTLREEVRLGRELVNNLKKERQHALEHRKAAERARDEAHEAHEECRRENGLLRIRINHLEAAIRAAGIPIPNGEHAKDDV